MSPLYDFEACNRLPIFDVAQKLGLDVRNSAARCWRPSHEDRRPSVALVRRANRWRCERCDAGKSWRSCLELVMEKLNFDLKQAGAWFGENFHVPELKTSPRASPSRNTRRSEPLTTLPQLVATEWFRSLSLARRAVFVDLFAIEAEQGATFRMSIRKLAERLGMAPNTVTDAVHYFEGIDLLSIKRGRAAADRNATNTYQLKVRAARFQNLLFGKGKRVLEKSGEVHTTDPSRTTSQTSSVSRSFEGTSSQPLTHLRSEGTSSQPLTHRIDTEAETPRDEIASVERSESTSSQPLTHPSEKGSAPRMSQCPCGSYAVRRLASGELECQTCGAISPPLGKPRRRGTEKVVRGAV